MINPTGAQSSLSSRPNQGRERQEGENEGEGPLSHRRIEPQRRNDPPRIASWNWGWEATANRLKSFFINLAAPYVVREELHDSRQTPLILFRYRKKIKEKRPHDHAQIIAFHQWLSDAFIKNEASACKSLFNKIKPNGLPEQGENVAKRAFCDGVQCQLAKLFAHVCETGSPERSFLELLLEELDRTLGVKSIFFAICEYRKAVLALEEELQPHAPPLGERLFNSFMDWAWRGESVALPIELLNEIPDVSSRAALRRVCAQLRRSCRTFATMVTDTAEEARKALYDHGNMGFLLNRVFDWYIPGLIRDQMPLHCEQYGRPFLDNQIRQLSRLDQLSGSPFLRSLSECLGNDLVPVITQQGLLSFFQKQINHRLSRHQREIAGTEQQSLGSLNTPLWHTIAADAIHTQFLVPLFLRMAEKFPAVRDPNGNVIQDTFTRVGHYLRARLQEQCVEEGPHSAEMLLNAVRQFILVDLFEIQSDEDFNILPSPWRELFSPEMKELYQDLNRWLTHLLSEVPRAFQEVAAQHPQHIEWAKSFGIQPKEVSKRPQDDPLLLILADDIARFAVSPPRDEVRRLATLSLFGSNSYCEELAMEGKRTAQLLLTHGPFNQFSKYVQAFASTAPTLPAWQSDTQKVQHLLSQIVLPPLTRLVDRTINFEHQLQNEDLARIASNFLSLATQHLQAIRLTSERSPGRMQAVDYVRQMGNTLHPAVPTRPILYEKSIAVIKARLYGAADEELAGEEQERWAQMEKELPFILAKQTHKEISGQRVNSLDDVVNAIKECYRHTHGGMELTAEQHAYLQQADRNGITLRGMIRQEAVTHVQQRREHFFKRASNAFLALIFPRGHLDLTFIPEQERKVIWELFQKTIFPKQLLPLLMEILLEPDVLQEMVLSSLTQIGDSLSMPLSSSDVPLPPPSAAEAQMCQAANSLVEELFKGIHIPSAVKWCCVGSDGQLRPGIKESLGVMLRQKLQNRTADWLKDLLRNGVEVLVKRKENQQGEEAHVIDWRRRAANPVPHEERMEKKMQRELKRIARLLIPFIIKKFWNQWQVNIDRAITRACGRGGLKVKQALDWLCRIVFFKIIGSLLYYLFGVPLSYIFHRAVYRLLALKENQRRLLDPLVHLPDDQVSVKEGGLWQDRHVVYQEHLLYRLVDALIAEVETVSSRAPHDPHRVS